MIKKYLPFIAVGVAIVMLGAVAAFFAYGNKESNNGENKQKNSSINLSEPLCDQIPSSVIEDAIGKKIINTDQTNNSTTSTCNYYVDATHFIALRLNNLSYETQKKGQIVLDRKIITNPAIKAEHFIAIQDDGLINDIVLKINDSLFIAIDRSSGTTFSEDDMTSLAVAIAGYINRVDTQAIEKTKSNSNQSTISTIDDEKFIKNFFGLIESKKSSDAVSLMTNKNTSDDSIKQAWGVQFNNMSSIKVISTEANMKDNWTDSYRQYKVILDISMNPNSANAPIPYYGYENGQNSRYINLIKEDGAWRVDAIATGP